MVYYFEGIREWIKRNIFLKWDLYQLICLYFGRFGVNIVEFIGFWYWLKGYIILWFGWEFFVIIF